MAATNNGKLHPDGAHALFHEIKEITDIGILFAECTQKQAHTQQDLIQKGLGRVAAKTKEALKMKQDEDRLTEKLDSVEEMIHKRFNEEKAQEILREADEASSATLLAARK